MFYVKGVIAQFFVLRLSLSIQKLFLRNNVVILIFPKHLHSLIVRKYTWKIPGNLWVTFQESFSFITLLKLNLPLGNLISFYFQCLLLKLHGLWKSNVIGFE